MNYEIIDLIARKGKRLKFKLMASPVDELSIQFIADKQSIHLSIITGKNLLVYGYIDSKTKWGVKYKYKHFIRKLTKLRIEYHTIF